MNEEQLRKELNDIASKLMQYVDLLEITANSCGYKEDNKTEASIRLCADEIFKLQERIANIEYNYFEN